MVRRGHRTIVSARKGHNSLLLAVIYLYQLLLVATMSSSSPTTSRVASSPTTSHLPNNGGEENIMTDVTKLNFLEQSNDLIARLPNAAWIAVDEEMTGINLPNTKRPSKDDTPANRYPTLKQVSERYSIIQLGICLFEEAGTTTSPEGVETMKFHVVRNAISHCDLFSVSFYLWNSRNIDIHKETIQIHSLSS
jgi:hypothetical protein